MQFKSFGEELNLANRNRELSNIAKPFGKPTLIDGFVIIIMIPVPFPFWVLINHNDNLSNEEFSILLVLGSNIFLFRKIS